ncbi:MAG: hypothetical protein AAF652_05890, partial [Cyanobacteria bacterium P01_C01_bin.72]
YCAFLLFNKFRDQECSKTDPISWLVVAIASIFWMLVIPISMLELSIKAKTKTRGKAPEFKTIKTTVAVQ